jgi:hypothetical protein
VLPLDLHVLGLPLAFILSQDQTLHCKFEIFLACKTHQWKLMDTFKLVLTSKYQRTLFNLLAGLPAEPPQFFIWGCKCTQSFYFCKPFEKFF